MTRESALKKVVIAGRDAAAWLAANALVRAFGRAGLQVEVVELPSLLRESDVMMSLPALEAFHHLLGFDEHQMLKATGGVYSLGQSFANFSGARPPFLHPYGGHGAPFGGVPFHQLWLRARMAGLSVAFEDFSLTAAAAKRNRFFVANSGTRVFGRCDYSYHLKGAAYVRFLRAHALRRGVTHIQARHFAAATESESGHIRALVLGDGREVEGDLFIDATGSDSLLLGEQLGVGIDDWSAWFPGDRMLVTAAARMRTLPSYSQVRALRSGCLHVAPVQDSTGLAYTFAGGATDDEQAFRDLSVVAGMPMQPDATVSALRPGRRTLAWAGNCVALGEAACVFDPIDGPGLHSLQLGLAHLVSLFPVSRRCAVESAEYNRIMREALERFRDYQIAHYKLNRIYDEPLWDQLRDAKVPEALARKIDMFQARGTVTIYDEETFQADDWLSLFIGHGLTARTCDPLAEMAPQDDAIRHIQRLLSEIRQRVEGMDSHEAYIELFAAGDFAAQGGRSYTF